jgi:hypothetical protein
MMRGLVGALAVGALLTLAACGSDNSDASPKAPSTSSTAAISVTPLKPTKPSAGPRPTLAQLQAAIGASKNVATGKHYTAKQGACIGKVLLATNLSDGALNALAANIGSYVPSGAEGDTFKAAIPKIIACTK